MKRLINPYFTLLLSTPPHLGSVVVLIISCQRVSLFDERIQFSISMHQFTGMF